MAMLFPNDQNENKLADLLDPRRRASTARPDAKAAGAGNLELCSQPAMQLFIERYRQLHEGKGLLQAFADDGSLLDAKTTPRRDEQAPERPWFTWLETIRDVFSRKTSPPASQTASDAQLAAARRTIYALAISGETLQVRIAAVNHLSGTFSKEKQSAIKHGIQSLDTGSRASAMHTLARYDRSECMQDQNFLFDIARSGAADKDRILALRQLKDEVAVAAAAVLDGVFGNIAEAALEQLTDEEMIFVVARQARSLTIRCKAGGLITNQRMLKHLARKSPDAGVRRTAIERLEATGVLAKTALRDSDPDVREAAIKRVKNLRILHKAALHDDSTRVRKAALHRITDPKVLGRAATQDGDPYVRVCALAKVQDQHLLSSIAVGDPEPDVRIEAVRRLTDPHVLTQIATNDDHLDVRQAAADAVDDEGLRQQIEALKRTHREGKKLLVLDLASQYLASLPLEAPGDFDDATTGTAEDAIKVLASYGMFEDLGDDADPAVDAWHAIQPSHTDILTGAHIDRAEFLLDVRFTQSGTEHFKEFTYLNVARTGDDRYAWWESGGTLDD